MSSSQLVVAAPSMVTGFPCYFCKAPSPQLQDGWLLYDDRRAGLCEKCFFAYEKGTFCSVFHAKNAGWAECETCKTIFHSGCSMSSHLYTTTDCGKIRCSHCCFMESLKRTKIENPHPPVPSTEVKLLFEKKLTATDANVRNGRLVVPKGRGEVCFPEVEEGEGVSITIFDAKGYQWNIGYRCWKNSKMNVLEGLRDFKKLWKLHPGDIASFYRIEKKILVDVTRSSQESK